MTTNQSPEGLADEREGVAAENLRLALENGYPSATPLEASKVMMELTSMYSHRGDGIPTRYVHGSEVAAAARTMWSALIAALRAHTGAGDALLREALKRAALDLHEAAGRFGCIKALNANTCSDLTREAAVRADKALSRTPDPLSELQRLGQECDREPFDRKAVLEEVVALAEQDGFVSVEQIRALSKDGEQDLCAEIAQKSGEGDHG